VTPEANPDQRTDRARLERYYMRSASGDSIPVSALVDTRLDAEPRSLKQFNGLYAATISLMMPGVSMQEALDYLGGLQQQMLPAGFSVNFSVADKSGQAIGILPARNGRTQVAFDPINFIARLVAPVRKPRVNLIRYPASRHRTNAGAGRSLRPSVAKV
jgi:hypothetical protein